MNNNRKELPKGLILLEKLDIKYHIKNNSAILDEWDSLNITLTGSFAGYWKRWSTNDQGKNYIELIEYLKLKKLIPNIDIDYEEINNELKEDHSIRTFNIPKAQKTDFNN